MSVLAYGGQKRTPKPLELEQEVVVSYHVSPGTERVLWESSKCS